MTRNQWFAHPIETTTSSKLSQVLQGDTLAPYMFVICLDYVPRMSTDRIKESIFALKKTRSRRYPSETMKNVNYVDDLAFLANILDRAKSRRHSLVQSAEGIGLYLNPDKTEFLCFKQEIAISTLSSKPFNLVDQFIYLGGNISSTVSDVNMRRVKEGAAIDRVLIIWKSDLSDKIKQDFFQVVAVFVLL